MLFSVTFAQTFQAGCYTIKNQNSNLAIQDDDIIRQQGVNNGNNQKWNFEATSGGYFKITSQSSSEVITSSNCNNGNQLKTEPWNGANNQQWRVEARDGGTFALINRDCDKGFLIPDWSTNAGQAVVLYGQGDDAQMRFFLTSCGGTVSCLCSNGQPCPNGDINQCPTTPPTFQAGCYTIKNQNSNLAIQDDDIIRQQGVNNGNNQKWNFEATSGGYFKITSQSSSEVITSSNCNNGNQLKTEPWNGANNQQWRVEARDGGTFALINRECDKGFLIPDWSTNAGQAVVLYGQGDDAQMRFFLTSCGGTVSCLCSNGQPCPNGDINQCPTTPPTFQAGCYTIRNKHSNLAIQDDDFVKQQGVGTGNNQKWNFEATSGGYFKITSQSSSEVITTSNCNNGNLLKTELWNGANNQQWRVEARDGGTYAIINRECDKGFIIPEWSTTPGQNVKLYGQGDNDEMRFILTSCGGTGCTSPIPSISSNLPCLNSGQSATLTATGCNGTISWSNGSNGTTITVGTGTYSANCTQSGCTQSNNSTILIINCTPTQFSSDNERYYLSNGIIKVGFDRRMGGAISYLAKLSDGRNIINNNDAGRQAGFETRISPDEIAKNTWKPIPAGKVASDIFYLTDLHDAGGATRQSNGLPQGSFEQDFTPNTYLSDMDNMGGEPIDISFNNNTGELYIKAKLWEWGFVEKYQNSPTKYRKIDTGCYNETWIKLNGQAVEINLKQTRNIPYYVVTADPIYNGLQLSVFANTNVPFDKLYTYNGSMPWTSQGLTSTHVSGNYDIPTENWMALIDETTQYGIGIYSELFKELNRSNPYTDFAFYSRRTSGGCHGNTPEACSDGGDCSFTTYNYPCGASCTNNSTTIQNFSFIAGTVSEIRKYAKDRGCPTCTSSTRIGIETKLDQETINPIITIAPNPVSEYLIFDIKNLSKDTNKEIIITDSHGNQMNHMFNKTEDHFEINVNSYKPGSYILTIVSQDYIITNHFVVN
ncbi:hypothetical protein GCM10011514_45220 [Emticicia aquatilis]|uniref:T9SS C-terminal target domain-containing protein n=2 Tax=Emticicia aquatilis TaxID=1537369 RepID=A0A917DWS5_9BACT|nr:hypothetical protein GCM10011514_45220 [Emticicia aquatilis]